MPEFHGYPQHEDAHPERPWWRMRGMFWVRSGGHNVPAIKPWRGIVDGLPKERPSADVLADMDATDREHPLPAPPPMCGQVWRVNVPPHAECDYPSAYDVKVDRISYVGTIPEIVWLGAGRRGVGEWRHGDTTGFPQGRDPSFHPLPEAWPPPNAVLVAGPGAPWAPPPIDAG